MRRQDRQISKEKALQILDTEEFGVLSLIDTDGLPYGIPINFVRNGDVLILHCALEGKKIDCIEKQPCVSFCVVGQTRIRPERYTTEYESVIAEGVAQIIEDENQKTTNLIKLANKYFPHNSHEANLEVIQRNLQRTRIIEIQIKSINGKAEKPI